VAEVVLSVDVDASPEAVFAALADWSSQGEWMLGTRVWQETPGPTGAGTRLAAFTGVGRLGFLDTMQVTAWDPPRRCLVRHDGSVVRGAGAFEVEPLPDGRSRFHWSEWLDLPLGRLGELGWLVTAPAFVAGVRLSLRRFARWVEARQQRLSSDTP
jgi:uncharacterized protein YndB with AHSA1/START domain